jgi:hypothetical protein
MESYWGRDPVHMAREITVRDMVLVGVANVEHWPVLVIEPEIVGVYPPTEIPRSLLERYQAAAAEWATVQRELATFVGIDDTYLPMDDHVS